MRELSATMAATAARKASAQTSASIAVLLSVNTATSNWLRRASLVSGENVVRQSGLATPLDNASVASAAPAGGLTGTSAQSLAKVQPAAAAVASS